MHTLTHLGDVLLLRDLVVAIGVHVRNKGAGLLQILCRREVPNKSTELVELDEPLTCVCGGSVSW